VAAQQLADALDFAKTLRFPQARSLADTAASEYVALGDRDRAAQAIELRSFLDQRQTLIGGVLLLLGLGGVALSLARRSLTPEPEPW
jgi:GAF domain-containing protein